jgi:hypothetical protein
MLAHSSFRNGLGRSIGSPLDALRPSRGAGRIEHVVTRNLADDRRGRLRDCFLVVGTETGLRFVHHVEQWPARLANQASDLLGAFRRRDEYLGTAVLHDVIDLVRREVAADRGVIEPAPLRGPADLHEGEPVFHQQCNVIAGVQPQRTKQMRALVRKLVELAIGDRLARARHLVGDLVGMRAGVGGRVGHRVFLRNSTRVPRMQRSTIRAFTRVFDTLWWCAADPGSMELGPGSAKQRRALHRVRDTRDFTAFPRSSHWPCRRLRTWSAGRSACCAASVR